MYFKNDGGNIKIRRKYKDGYTKINELNNCNIKSIVFEEFINYNQNQGNKEKKDGYSN